MENVKDKVERWKLLANTFIKNNTSAFIKEINGDLHFCKILVNGDDSVLIVNFAPEQRAEKKEMVYWYLIEDFDEYKERTENDMGNKKQ